MATKKVIKNLARSLADFFKNTLPRHSQNFGELEPWDYFEPYQAAGFFGKVEGFDGDIHDGLCISFPGAHPPESFMFALAQHEEGAEVGVFISCRIRFSHRDEDWGIYVSDITAKACVPLAELLLARVDEDEEEEALERKEEREREALEREQEREAA